MSWDAQAWRVRQAQQRLDAKLSAYAQLATEVAVSASPFSTTPAVTVDMSSGTSSTTPDSASLEVEIQTLLAQYAEAQAELSTFLNDPALPPTQKQLHTIQRHRELLMELERDFFRTKTHLQHTVSRQQLLGHVKEDIDAYRADHTSETQAYLNERERLDRSQRMMDDTLEYVAQLTTQSSFRNPGRVPCAARAAAADAAADDACRSTDPRAERHSDTHFAPSAPRHGDCCGVDRRVCVCAADGRHAWVKKRAAMSLVQEFTQESLG